MNNIFDVSSNIEEWTSEANQAINRILRGAYCDMGNNYTASTRDSRNPTFTSSNYGSRLALYLK